MYVGSDAATVLRDIGEGLLTFDESGGLVGGMAESWHVSDDGRRIQFTLRPGLRWSNGVALTVDDVVESFRALVDPTQASPHASLATAIENAAEIVAGTMTPDSLGVRGIEPGVVEISLNQPTGYFLELLAHPAMQPQYTKSSDSLVSNGAYEVVEQLVGSSIRLRRNMHYWNAGSVEIADVEYHVVDQNMEPIRFDAGELEITDNVSEIYFSKYAGTPELRLAPMLGVYYLGLNLKSPSLRRNVQLRRALYLAVDREVIVDRILARGEIAAFRFVPPAVQPCTDLDSNVPARAERLTLAKQQIAEAGLNPSAVDIELLYNTGGGHERITSAVASMWRDGLGIEVSTRAEEFKVFLQTVRAMIETEVFRLSWTADYNDPYTFLQLFESQNSGNVTGFEDRNYDQMIESANATLDPVIRRNLLCAAERYLMQQVPVIPVYYYVSKHLVSPRVLGWQDNPMDVHKSQYLRFAGAP